MKSSILSLITFALVAIVFVKAYDNLPPISGRHPGYSYGTGSCGVEIEIVYDLMCSDSAELDPEF